MLIEREKVEEIGRKLTVFNLKSLRELVTLSKVLEREGLSLGDVENFLETTMEIQRVQVANSRAMAEARQKQWNKNTRKCPTCGKPLVARRIATSKGKANREGYTCQWYCQEEDCLFEEYTHESYQEIYSKIMGG